MKLNDDQIHFALLMACMNSKKWSDESAGFEIVRWGISQLMAEPLRPLTTRILREFLGIATRTVVVSD